MKTMKKISTFTAFVMALSMLAAGCEKTDDDGGEIPSLDEITLTTAETEETDVPEVTTTVPETTAPETSSETTSEETTSETTVSSEGTTAPETSETAAQTWNETELSATMYVVENCYSRERAIIGSTPISQHYAGDSVEVIAITDTEYYKLAEGGFIHSDYLSDTKPVTTEATTTAESYSGGDLTGDNTGSGENDNAGSEDFSSDSGDLDDANYAVKSSSRYAYKQLTADEQTLYNRVVSSVKKLDSVVEIPAGMSSDDVVRIYAIVYNNEPQLFWMGGSISAGTSFATISFKTTDKNEIKSMQKEIDSAAADIVSKAKNYSGTVSKLKVFYDSVVLKNEFSKSDSGYNCSIYNGLTGKGALQCAGYAKTIQYLCDLAGIESTVVVGTDKNENSHAWNVVYCENGYYNLDATWGDPINDFDSSYIQYEFFLVPDAWIHNITHYNVNTMVRGNGNKIHLYDPPACTKEACNYFAAYNKVYSSKTDAENAFYAAIDEAVANKKNVAEIRVSDKSIYDSLMTDDYFRTFQKYAKGKYSNVSKLLRQSSFTGGVYVVHYDIVYTD